MQPFRDFQAQQVVAIVVRHSGRDRPTLQSAHGQDGAFVQALQLQGHHHAGRQLGEHAARPQQRTVFACAEEQIQSIHIFSEHFHNGAQAGSPGPGLTSGRKDGGALLLAWGNYGGCRPQNQEVTKSIESGKVEGTGGSEDLAQPNRADRTPGGPPDPSPGLAGELERRDEAGAGDLTPAILERQCVAFAYVRRVLPLYLHEKFAARRVAKRRAADPATAGDGPGPTTLAAGDPELPGASGRSTAAGRRPHGATLTTENDPRLRRELRILHESPGDDPVPATVAAAWRRKPAGSARSETGFFPLTP